MNTRLTDTEIAAKFRKYLSRRLTSKREENHPYLERLHDLQTFEALVSGSPVSKRALWHLETSLYPHFRESEINRLSVWHDLGMEEPNNE